MKKRKKVKDASKFDLTKKSVKPMEKQVEVSGVRRREAGGVRRDWRV